MLQYSIVWCSVRWDSQVSVTPYLEDETMQMSKSNRKNDRVARPGPSRINRPTFRIWSIRLFEAFVLLLAFPYFKSSYFPSLVKRPGTKGKLLLYKKNTCIQKLHKLQIDILTASHASFAVLNPNNRQWIRTHFPSYGWSQSLKNIDKAKFAPVSTFFTNTFSFPGNFC